MSMFLKGKPAPKADNTAELGAENPGTTNGATGGSLKNWLLEGSAVATGALAAIGIAKGVEYAISDSASSLGAGGGGGSGFNF